MVSKAFSFDDESRIFGKMYDISVKTDEKIKAPVLNDFYYDPSVVPHDKLLSWSKAVDFNTPVALPSGEKVTGFRFIDFKDCTNQYYVNDKDEGRSFFSLPDADQAALLEYMDSFADKRKQQQRRIMHGIRKLPVLPARKGKRSSR